MPCVRLLHWKAEEAAALIQLLQGAGHRVEYVEEFRPALMRAWRESPPDAFIVDLSRLPSQGREIAVALRRSPATRRIPIVFVQGAKEKIDRIRCELPDAHYSTLAELASTLKLAIARPPTNPVKPVQMMDRYASRTAAQKLGIGASSRLALIDPPRDCMKVIGDLPHQVEILEDAAAIASVTLCFVHHAHSLRATLSAVRKLAGKSKLWILWRKGGSSLRGDVTERLVRESGTDLGLVDYKICSVNEVWSAMLFAPKR